MERCVFAGVVRRERALSAGKTVECNGACATATRALPAKSAMAKSERSIGSVKKM
jgi:hypothetical protein